MHQAPGSRPFRYLLGLVVVASIAGLWVLYGRVGTPPAAAPRKSPAVAPSAEAQSPLVPRKYIAARTRDSSGFFQMMEFVKPWPQAASLPEIAEAYRRVGYRTIDEIDRKLAASHELNGNTIASTLVKVLMFNYEGQPDKAYEVLSQLRSRVEPDDQLAHDWLFTIIHLQGVVSLRRGENDNCILCRGDSSCILPIRPAAIHTNPAGSRQAIAHFTEYLGKFPDQLEVRWLLNLAHMTLDEHPQQVDPRYLVSLDHFRHSEFDIGRFRDVGQQVGVNRFNQSGGAIMEDFDGDGVLDIVVTSIDPTVVMAFYRGTGNGTFEDCTKSAGLVEQLGGLNCMQTDYNNDGHMDVFIPRGAWFMFPVRPSLLENNGNGTFTDVTEAAGLLDPVNSNAAAWADYDNDGWLDLFICCERQPNRLFHNEQDGTFVEVAVKAGVQQDDQAFCKGAAWIDFDNDDYPDLFLNNLNGDARLFRNNRDGTFTDCSRTLGIDGPREGFPCWAWDYDNDGWLDIFATSYFRSVEGVVKGLLGEPFKFSSNRLFRNDRGQRFEDQTRAAGLDLVLAAMGCNYGDFDNDGFLDMYLGTGAPGFDFLVPNRMFKNVAGDRFAEITASSGTGHLQKGHGIACGDWDRDGNTDIFLQIGGPAIGDRFHNVLFQNPGQTNRWLKLKLVGQATNRPAIGARIKVITDEKEPRAFHRHVSSGSSFGANPLEQNIGLGAADRVASLEIHWPTSGTTQVFRDIDAWQTIEVTEFADHYRKLDWKPLPTP